MKVTMNTVVKNESRGLILKAQSGIMFLSIMSMKVGVLARALTIAVCVLLVSFQILIAASETRSQYWLLSVEQRLVGDMWRVTQGWAVD
jgi:hypothetical protein